MTQLFASWERGRRGYRGEVLRNFVLVSFGGGKGDSVKTGAQSDGTGVSYDSFMGCLFFIFYLLVLRAFAVRQTFTCTFTFLAI